MHLNTYIYMYLVNIRFNLYLEHMLKTNKIPYKHGTIQTLFRQRIKFSNFEKNVVMWLKLAVILSHLRIASEMSPLWNWVSTLISKNVRYSDEFQSFWQKIQKFSKTIFREKNFAMTHPIKKLTWISALFCGDTGQYTLFFNPSGKIGWPTDDFTFDS